MPIVNDLLPGNRGGGPRVFLHLNWYATEICMPCKHILRFRDLLTRTARSLGSNKKFIPSMPHVPKSAVYRVCQIFLRALKAQVSSLNLQLNRSPCLSFDVQVIGHLHDDVFAISFIFLNLIIQAKLK